MRLVVHGGVELGAGTDPPSSARGDAVEAAATDGAREPTPVEAVVTAVSRLETDDRFNAGRGGAVQSDGVVRVDAGLMTDDLTVGAVAAVPGVEHPVSAARGVATDTPHVLLAGEEAAAFAADVGVETGVDLTTEATRRRFADADPPDGSPRDHLDWLRGRFGGADTVGAVARDGDRFAAATSTAGRWFALAGRVGDVPQVGAGFYCSSAGGASATGAGEDVARVTLARRAVDHLEAGVPADRAATRAVEAFEAATGACAGLIVCGPDGVGSAHNGASMQVRTAVA